MKTYDQWGNQRKIQDLRFRVFLTSLQNNDFDKIIEETISLSQNKIQILSEKIIDVNKDFSIMIDSLMIEMQLQALAEMKIVYAYKCFENSLNHLLESMVHDFKKFHRWENLKKFLTKKNIEIAEIDSFKNVDQLRCVNNAIKHSNILKLPDIIDYPEFRDTDLVNYLQTLAFYERVKDSPFEFLRSLRKLVLENVADDEFKRLY